jgi:hypothetical protein
MSILDYFQSSEDEEKNHTKSMKESESDSSNDNDQNLTSIQRAKKKYMKKYTQTEKFKQINKDNFKKYYEQNSKNIYEERRKRMTENPELYEKFKEQQRLYASKRREKLKSLKNEE